MKFFELAVGDKFEYNGLLYEKVKEERLSCCQVKLNARLYGTENTTIVVKPLEDVKKFENTPTNTDTKPAGGETK